MNAASLVLIAIPAMYASPRSLAVAVRYGSRASDVTCGLCVICAWAHSGSKYTRSRRSIAATTAAWPLSFSRLGRNTCASAYAGVIAMQTYTHEVRGGVRAAHGRTGAAYYGTGCDEPRAPRCAAPRACADGADNQAATGATREAAAGRSMMWPRNAPRAELCACGRCKAALRRLRR